MHPAIGGTGVNFIVFVMVTGALLLASMYHSILYYYNRLQLIGHYTVYLWSVFIYCAIRTVYYYNLPEKDFFVPDEALQMTSFALYIRFSKIAMELDALHDRLAYWFCKIGPTFIAIYIVSYSIIHYFYFHHTVSVVVLGLVYFGIRAFLLFVGFTSLVAVIKKRNNIYFRYIFYGIFSIILIGLLATILEIFWKNNAYLNSLTALAIGYNIDLFFFSAAISYKVRSETIEKEKANQRVLEQELEIQKNMMERVILSFKIKEEERSRIATELHDEIGSTISSISILSDVIIKEKNETSIRSMQQEIKNNTKLIMEKMDDIIWSLNPRNDSMEKMLLRIKQFATPLFEARNINYEYEISSDVYAVPLPIEKRQQAYLIIKEAINNLIKHSACTEALFQAIISADNTLVFTIADNGMGFKTDTEASGNGLLNMQHRAHNIGAVIDFDTAQGKGTSITLAIKIG